MHAFRGDLVHLGGLDPCPRQAEVLHTDHPDGRPPYWVRWTDSGEEGLLFPDARASVEHAGPAYVPEYDAPSPGRG